MAVENTILLIDDNERSRHDLDTVLSFLGETTLTVSSNDCLALLGPPSEQAPVTSIALIGSCERVALADLLAALYQREPGMPFVLLGESASVQLDPQLDPQLKNQVVATLSGALSYQPLLDALHKAKVFQDHYNRLRNYAGVRDYNMFRSLVGTSNAVERIRHMMGQVANTEVSVLITGESGTGKEVVARNLHLNSARAEKPFIPINCGAIPRELLESELFGHEKGAFTGAIAARAGRFELADGGTLFLDEIGDMPLSMQVKLLRVLQERSFERVGGVKTIETDVRILAATHKNLEEMIDEGAFRQDLYYRLNVFPIEMPPLRERAEDVPQLLNELISIMEKEQRGSVRFNSAAIAVLCQHAWPGNVRELANLIERMAILHPHGIIGRNDLPAKLLDSITQAASHTIGEDVEAVSAGKAQPAVVAAIAEVAISEGEAPSVQLPAPSGLDLKEYLANLEKDLIAQALDDSGWVVARAAERLNMRRTTLIDKIAKYNLQKASSFSKSTAAQASDADRSAANVAGLNEKEVGGTTTDDSGSAASA